MATDYNKVTIENYTLPEFYKMAQGPTKFSNDDIHWAGGLTKEKALEYTLKGDESCVQRAEKLMDKLDADLNVETYLPSWVPAPCGAYPIVAEYLAGEPTCMRNRQDTSVNAPIKVAVCILSSAVIDAKDMFARGATIMALVLKLQQIRPVEISLVMPWVSPTYTLVVNLESKPLDLSTAAFCVGHPAFFRELGHSVLMREHYRGSSPNTNWEDVKTQVDIGSNDLFINSIVAGDPLVKDPLGWIQEQLAKFNKGVE